MKREFVKTLDSSSAVSGLMTEAQLDELSGQEQLALLKLIENGRLTKTIKPSREIESDVWVFVTANNGKGTSEPLLDGIDRE